MTRGEKLKQLFVGQLPDLCIIETSQHFDMLELFKGNIPFILVELPGGFLTHSPVCIWKDSAGLYSTHSPMCWGEETRDDPNT